MRHATDTVQTEQTQAHFGQLSQEIEARQSTSWKPSKSQSSKLCDIIQSPHMEHLNDMFSHAAALIFCSIFAPCLHMLMSRNHRASACIFLRALCSHLLLVFYSHMLHGIILLKVANHLVAQTCQAMCIQNVPATPRHAAQAHSALGVLLLGGHIESTSQHGRLGRKTWRQQVVASESCPGSQCKQHRP